MAILAVHYPFHYKSCCLLKLGFGLGAKRGFGGLKLPRKPAGRVHGLFIGLTAQLGDLMAGLFAGGLDRGPARVLRVGAHLPRLRVRLGDGGLRVRFSLCYAGDSLK